MKRAIMLACALVLFCLPVSCSEPAPRSDPDAIKADAMDDPYGVATEGETAVLQSSGEVVLYWDTADRSERERDFEEYFSKYFGGTVVYRFCPLDDDAATLIADQATGNVPDVFRMTAGYWPRAAMHALTYPRSYLVRQGVFGLDHPALVRYRDVTEAGYSFNGDCFALSVCVASPVMVAVNVDLFNANYVRSPVSYFEVGEWDTLAFQRCCYELSRTAPGGRTLMGAVVRDPLWFLQANDADPMVFRDTYLTGDLMTPAALEALSYCRGLLTSGSVTDDEKAFLQGDAGLLCDVADRLAGKLVNCAFEWDVVPFPFGGNNVSGARPGSMTGWAIPFGAKNLQGAVNYVIARQRFLDFHYNVDGAAFWDINYAFYSEAQRQRVIDAAHMVRPALFPHFGTLPDEVEGLLSSIRGQEPVFDVADRYTALIRAAISEEIAADP